MSEELGGWGSTGIWNLVRKYDWEGQMSQSVVSKESMTFLLHSSQFLQSIQIPVLHCSLFNGNLEKYFFSVWDCVFDVPMFPNLVQQRYNI